MRKKKIIGAIVMLGLTASLFVGCGGSNTESSGKSAETLKLTSGGALKTIDSVKATDEVSHSVTQNTQETLLVYNDNKPVPGAAESYDKSKDGKTYTFHLRKGLKWSDGKELTAKDFEYSWKRLLDPKVASQYAFFLFKVKNGENYFNGKAKVEDVGIKATDDNTLVVTLENPVPYFDQLVAYPNLAPQRKDIVESQGDKYGSDPSKLVYSGPFTVSNWQKGSKFELKKNPNYWNAKDVKLNEVDFMELTEQSTIYQMFTNNQLDVMGGQGEFLAKLQQGAKDGKWNEVTGTAPSVFYGQYNIKSKNKALSNPKVRLALSIASDREGYTKDVLKRAIPAYGLVPQGIAVGDVDYRDKVEQPLKKVMNEDPKKLLIEGLKEAGLDPDPAKHTFKFLLQTSDATAKSQGEFMQNTWKQKLGVNIELVTAADFSDFLTKLDNGDFEIASAGWGADFNDPITFLDLFGKSNTNNTGKYNDAKVNELLEKLNTETDNNKRLEMYKEIEQIEVVKNPAVTPTYYKDIHSFQKKNVKGLQLPKFGGTYQLRWTSIGE
ncbi:peptide ABC transporter substrate-binding protein [Clostridium sardiniense]|uniref:Peptide ABC transporter substrate-binding protein n=1 Tax=Clostridium sardiniense TaxID=29369 RepID=A0ABS7KT28_CLOSR|nr:peptide ABC transporter substrate-binding protein [Clostridium sardiniense]MBY0753959.1 peptide ABC transporter substrate-binding protein [Clostridium sardiniense]MDQ0459525.1 oligopeptide transport system substrate-binding protein [Clostridium sardiniense]